MNRQGVFRIGCMIGIFLFWSGICAAAEWEGGVKVGFDSNVNHGIRQEKNDSFLLLSLSYNRTATGESRFDWIFGTTVEGAAYNRYVNLNYGLVNVSPGFLYFLNRMITVSLSPFFEAKAVKDSDQSALATGGKIMFREQITPSVYLGQYYLLRANLANVDTYSFTENTVGIFTGAAITGRISGEIGYEYSSGDSFRALPASTATDGKGGRSHGILSRVFGEALIRESVDRNAVGININVNWNSAIFSTVNYMYTSVTGDSGKSHSHSGFIDLGYRF